MDRRSLFIGHSAAMGRMFRWLAIFFLFCSASITSVAQTQPQPGTSRLASIEITGSTRYTSEQIVAAIDAHLGGQVTRDDLQKVANTLSQLGPFAKVSYRYSSADDGVRAEYQVIDAPALPVWLDNFPWFTDEELIVSLKSSVHTFDGTAPERGTLLDAISAALEKLLTTRGVHSRVSHALAIDPALDARVQEFHVENGNVNIAAIEFNDALAQGDHALQQRFADLVGKPFSRRAIELFEFEQIRPVYVSNGFLQVKFGIPTARFASGSGNSLPNSIVVVVPVEPGISYMWNGTTWSGNVAIQSMDLDKLITLKKDDRADGLKIEATWLSVSEAFARRGYLDAAVNPIPQFDQNAKRVSYAVPITEGPRYRMGKLILSGLSVEGERRIRTAWKIPPGMVFDKSVYEEFMATGVKQAFIGLPVGYEKIGRLLQTDPKSGTVDVLLDFQ